MSNTRKDRPLRVRIRQAKSTKPVHIGCPLADQPRYRRARKTTTSEPRWHETTVHYLAYPYADHEVIETDPSRFWLCKTRKEWVFGPVVIVENYWEPYWIDECDINRTGRHDAWKRCHYEADWRDPAVQKPGRSSQRRLSIYDPAERGAAKINLSQAARDWNTNSDTDLQPNHRPQDPWY